MVIIPLSETSGGSVKNANQETSIENNSSFDQEDDIEPITKKMKKTRETMITKLREQRNSRSIKKIVFQEQMLNHIREDIVLRKQELPLQREVAQQMQG